MDSLFDLIASSPPGYLTLLLVCIALLSVAWFFGIPLYQENKKLKEESVSLHEEMQARMKEYSSIVEKLDKITVGGIGSDTELLHTLATLRLYIEQSETAANISIESLSRAIEELIEEQVKSREYQNLRRAELSIQLSRYDADLRSINDKLSQLVGAAYSVSQASHRGIS